MRSFSRINEQEPRWYRLQLLPVLTLFAALVPLLLCLTSFSQAVNLRAGLLLVENKETQGEARERQLELRIERQRLVLLPRKGFNPAQRKAISTVFKSKGGAFELDRLRAHLIKLGTTVPQLGTIELVADDETTFNLLIALIDTVTQAGFAVRSGQNGPPTFLSTLYVEGER
ncbi:MAG: hypothetical protein A2284_03215 [Deltaproteobacteria bacterium RIFOXYA12_FULL_61_11]|nr:MAG: hypothetical protein A2284_03215 [Deltaproteobacteria bacterium RIFOXYA12_FULL_61_11]